MGNGRFIDDTVIKTNTTHKLADFLGNAAAGAYVTSLFWAPPVGVAVGVLAAPALGISAVFAGVAGAVGGLVTGRLALTTPYSPAMLISAPLDALSEKLYDVAYTGYLSNDDKARLVAAFNRVTIPGAESEKVVQSGDLYRTSGEEIYRGYQTIDSLVERLENKKWNTWHYFYKP